MPFFLLVLSGCAGVGESILLRVPTVVEGTVHLGDQAPGAGFIVPLDGAWHWFPDRFVPPGDAFGADPAGGLLRIPVSLSSDQPRRIGTLAVSVRVPDPAGVYVLKIPYFGSAYRLYVNEEPVSGNGSVADPYEPRYIPREITVRPDAEGMLRVVFHIANEHHRRIRLNRVYLGTVDEIQALTDRRIIRDAFLLGSFIVLGLYHLAIFLLNRRDLSSLLVAAIAWLSAMRLGVLTERLWVRIWPGLPAEIVMKLGYAPVFLLLPVVILYLRELSPVQRLEAPARIARWALLGFSALVILAPLRVYDAAFEYGTILLIGMGLWTLQVVLRTRSFRTHGAGVLFLISGILILGAAVSDYLREISVLQTPELLSVSFLLLVVIQASELAWRFRTSYDETSRLASEVRVLNLELEERIDDRTRELARTNRRLEEISRKDPLTGVSNRRHFEEVLDREWHHARLRGTPLALILVDVDEFKRFNDTYGHPAGDACLQRVSAILHGHRRAQVDTVARYGGEEFIVFLPGATRDAAVRRAEEIRAAVERTGIPHAGSGAASVVTVSAGVASIFPRDGVDPEELLIAADQALYRAKAGGRNRVEGAP